MRVQVCTVALLIAGMGMANGQVASHAPTMAIAQPATTAAGDINRPVAKVNGTVLTQRDLLREMYALFPYGRQHNGFPKDLEPQIRQGALQMIIFEELVYQEAKRRNMTVSPERMAKAQAEFRKQFHSDAEYKKFLQVELNGSSEALRAKIRRSLMIEALLKSEVDNKAVVTAIQAKAFYQQNIKQYEHGEIFHLQTISILPPANGGAEVAKEARRRADEALKQAKATKTYREFGLLAEKLSDDDYHVNMGDHKPTEAEKLPPPVVSVLRTMKAGQVSDLIQMGSAFTIVRLEAHTPAGKTAFAEVKGKLQSDLQKEKVEQLRVALGDRLRKNARIETL